MGASYGISIPYRILQVDVRATPDAFAIHHAIKDWHVPMESTPMSYMYVYIMYLHTYIHTYIQYNTIQYINIYYTHTICGTECERTEAVTNPTETLLLLSCGMVSNYFYFFRGGSLNSHNEFWELSSLT